MKKIVYLLVSGSLIMGQSLPVLAADFEEMDTGSFQDFETETAADPQKIYETAQIEMEKSGQLLDIPAAKLKELEQKTIENLPAPLSAAALQGNAVNMHELKQKVADLEKIASPNIFQKAQLEQAKKELEKYETTPVWRLYNPNSGEHFYTPSKEEQEALVKMGWKDESIGWQSMKAESSAPVYRLYNPNAGDHHYTPDAAERKALIELGWIDENIAWYADPDQGVPVYRTYNPNAKEAGAHHFTLDENEYTTLGKSGWVNEGVGFYAPAEKDGYSICEETHGGKTGIVWYDKNDQKLTGSKQIDGSWYYFEPDTGFMLQNTFFKAPDAAGYRVYGHDGKAVIGSVKIDGNYYGFYGPEGYMVQNRNMVMKDGSYYRLNEDGSVNTEAFTIGGVTFTPDADGRIEKVVHADVPVYMQTDSRWAKENFGNYRFQDIGCLPTTMTSVVNYFGGQSLTPIETGRMLEQNGYLNGSLALASRYPIGGVQQGILWLAQRYSLMVQGSLSEAQLKQILLQGGVLALSVGRSRFTDGSFSHEILVYGYDHGNVLVHDPLTPKNTGIYPLSDLYKIRNLDRYGRASGGPVFGFLNPNTGIAVE